MGNNNDDIKRALGSVGIPDNVIDYALKNKPVQDYNLLSGLLSFFIIISGFAALFIFENKIENVIDRESERYARSIDGILYNSSPGIWILPAGLGIILAASSITGWLTTLSERAAVTSFVLSLSDPKIPRLFNRINRWQIDRLSSETDPALYVRKFERAGIRIVAVPAALLLTISVLIAMRESETHEIFTPTAYVTSPFFPWEAPTSHDWASAVAVKTGCNHSSRRRGGADNHIVYTITFSDGAVARMGTAIPVGRSWPRAAEVVDRKLRAAGATFSPWISRWKDSYHPRCIAALRQRFSDGDFEHVKALLHAPE